MAAASSASPSPTSRPPQNTMSTHSTELVRGTHQFNIAGYSLQKRNGVGQSIRSSAFEVGGYSWKIIYYPAGYGKEDEEGYVSLFLDLWSTAVEKATVKFSFQINGPTGNSSPSVGWNDFTPSNKSWGFRKFAKIESVESQYLRNDCLTVHCTVEVLKESLTEATRSRFITVPPPGICQHLALLLEGKQGSDVTFQAGRSDYDAHRTVVAMRSPVFSAQFFGSLAYEAGGGGRYVRIHDMKPAAFEAVLHFIYTDTLPPVEDRDFLLSGSANCAELRETAAGCSQEGLREMVGDWLAAADRYDLERMRLMCENALCETISVENAAATLKLAGRHHCPQLKAFCMDYIASPGVLAAVIATEGFKELKVACPSLLAEVLEKRGSAS